MKSFTADRLMAILVGLIWKVPTEIVISADRRLLEYSISCQVMIILSRNDMAGIIWRFLLENRHI